jgi:hypothetical protein
MNSEQLLGLGYTVIPHFTISLALYYFSAIAQAQEDVYETIGDPSQLAWARKEYNRRAPAPQLREPPAVGEEDIQFRWIPEGNNLAFQYASVESDCSDIYVQRWGPKDRLGPKTWLATAFINGDMEKLVFKLWDSWHFKSADRDNEVTVYKHLKSLWGIVVPSLLAYGVVGFSHTLVISFIQNVFFL